MLPLHFMAQTWLLAPLDKQISITEVSMKVFILLTILLAPMLLSYLRLMPRLHFLAHTCLLIFLSTLPTSSLLCLAIFIRIHHTILALFLLVDFELLM